MSKERLVFLIYQYLCYTGSLYDEEARRALDKVRRSRSVTLSELDELQKLLYRVEFFRAVEADLCRLLKL